MIRCYAFAWVPAFARGQVRDLRVRWALEELELPYESRLVGAAPGAVPPDAYRAVQPFGQVPALEDDEVALFESGAIVLYLAERHPPRLWPSDPAARARVLQWSFAALNTIEPPLQTLAGMDVFPEEQRFAKERRPAALAFARRRLGELARCLDGRDFLVGAFSAADVLMASVLRIVAHTELLSEQPALAAYRDRCESRPAFQRALAAQLADFDRAEQPAA